MSSNAKRSLWIVIVAILAILAVRSAMAGEPPPVCKCDCDTLTVRLENCIETKTPKPCEPCEPPAPCPPCAPCAKTIEYRTAEVFEKPAPAWRFGAGPIGYLGSHGDGLGVGFKATTPRGRFTFLIGGMHFDREWSTRSEHEHKYLKCDAGGHDCRWKHEHWEETKRDDGDSTGLIYGAFYNW